MTAYVVAGLAQAKAAGIAGECRGASRKAPRGWRRISPPIPSWPATCAPTWLYALSVARPGRRRLVSRQVYDKRAGLSPYGLAILGLALEQAKDARAAEIAAALEAPREQDAGAGLVDRHARPDAGLLRGRHARSHRLRREVPLAPAPRQRAAAQGGAVADEPSQRRLSGGPPPSRPPW